MKSEQMNYLNNGTMHESEAMEFLLKIYCWFLNNYENYANSEEKEEFCLDKIRAFISDDNGYLVKKKTLFLIDDLLNFEMNHDYPPGDFDLSDAIDVSLKYVETQIFEYKNLLHSKNSTEISIPIPSFINSRKEGNSHQKKQKGCGMSRKVTRLGTLLYKGRVYEPVELIKYSGETVLVEEDGDELLFWNEQNEFICRSEPLFFGKPRQGSI